VTFEISEKHAQVARSNFEAAGVSDKVEVIVGPAVETLPGFVPDVPFDLAFIDADKQNNLAYFREAKRIVRQGGVIVSFRRITTAYERLNTNNRS
jgi:predicted O-methyltransferase YrrM